MQTDTRTLYTEHRTGGLWTHSGRFTVRFKLDDGTLAEVTLPDDFASGVTRAEFDALEARVAALEARAVIDAIEDLKYGN